MVSELNRPTPIFRSFTLQPLSNIKPSSRFKFSTFMLHVFLQPNLSRKLNHPFRTAPVLPTTQFGQSAKDPTPTDTVDTQRPQPKPLTSVSLSLCSLSELLSNTSPSHDIHRTSSPKKNLSSLQRDALLLNHNITQTLPLVHIPSNLSIHLPLHHSETLFSCLPAKDLHKLLCTFAMPSVFKIFICASLFCTPLSLAHSAPRYDHLHFIPQFPPPVTLQSS
jgi:hypothetical protein